MIKERKYIRVPLPLGIKYRFEDEDKFVNGTIEDIGWGGVFLKVNPVPAKGKRIMLEFEIPGESVVVSLWGTVVRVCEEHGKPVGVGIQFDELDNETRSQIQKLVDYWVRYLVKKMKK